MKLLNNIMGSLADGVVVIRVRGVFETSRSVLMTLAAIIRKKAV